MSKEHGHFHWNELMTRDREAAKAFYAETLGWTYDAFPMADGGDYAVCMMNGQPVGGMLEIKADAGHGGRRRDRTPRLRCPRRRPHRDRPGQGGQLDRLDHAGQRGLTP